MTITLNGKSQILDESAELLAILHDRQVDPAHVVVEINQSIIPRDAFATTLVNDGDAIEILRFVGGG